MDALSKEREYTGSQQEIKGQERCHSGRRTMKQD